MLESLIADIYIPVQVVPWYAIFCLLKVIMSAIRFIFLSRKYLLVFYRFCNIRLRYFIVFSAFFKSFTINKLVWRTADGSDGYRRILFYAIKAVII